MYSPGKQLQAPDDEEDQLQDLDFLISAGTLSTTKFNYETELMEEASFGLSSPKSKSAKKRKANITETHGGRIVRAAGRKDRHSKVCTASGPRDRRVRLSPRTAIQFYDVQDRLGYDRPSKAIDWLIKEAKAAIDALDEKNGSIINEENDQQMEQGFGEYLFSQNPCSGFGFLGDVAQLPCTTDQLQGFADHYLINPSSNRNGAPEYQDPIYSQGFCSDWDISRLQKILTVDSVNSSSILQPPDPAGGDGEIFSQREPLQSSIINYSPIISSHFPAGFSFSSELSKITGVGTIKEDIEKEKKSTVSSRPFSTAP